MPHPITQSKTNSLFWPDENSIEQCFAAHIVQGCQQYCSTLSDPIAGLFMLNILNNIVYNIDIFKPVFIRPEQVVHFSLFSTQLGTIEVLD